MQIQDVYEDAWDSWDAAKYGNRNTYLCLHKRTLVSPFLPPIRYKPT